MCIQQKQLLALDLQHDLQKPPLLSGAEHPVVMVLLLHYSEARQDRIAIVASLVIDILSKGIVHSSQGAELSDQVAPRSTLYISVYLLKRHDVSLLAQDNFCNAI